MVHVYCRYINTQREVSCGVYDTWKHALEHVAMCYNTDKKLNQLGECYYFAVER